MTKTRTTTGRRKGSNAAATSKAAVAAAKARASKSRVKNASSATDSTEGVKEEDPDQEISVDIEGDGDSPIAPQPEERGDEEEEEEDASEDTFEPCPACEGKDPKDRPSEAKTWVMCEACETWYHWACVGNDRALDTVDKWYCETCLSMDPERQITYKPAPRKSARTTNKLDYANINNGVSGDPKMWQKHLDKKPFSRDCFPRMKGEDVTLAWALSDEKAMTEPVIIETPEGLGMKMPDSTFTVSDVAKIVGGKEKVEVLDVASQREDKGWTLSSWAEYYNTPAAQREKIRNVISLEISETKLADKVAPPRLVKQLDWVEQVWPANRRKGPGMYPKVQLYCLMSVSGCWTDWHLDFAGSSVYYHILRGSKTFYFIRPTAANLAAYEKWSGSEVHQTTVWLGDWVDEVIKVELVQGNTMMIPTGWIHAVYTPSDSLVFGGNFLHSLNIATQLRVRDLEIATRVPKKFRFPFFRRLCWYVAEKAVKDLKSKEDFTSRVLEGYAALATFLIREARIIERSSSTEAVRRDSKDQVPATVKDASALAREFRWRVRLARGTNSDDESNTARSTSVKLSSSSSTALNGKRKRGVPSVVQKESSGSPAPPLLSSLSSRQSISSSLPSFSGPTFKGFAPRPWDLMPPPQSVEPEQSSQFAVERIPKREDDAGAWISEAEGSRRWAAAAGPSDENDDGLPLLKAKRVRRVDESVKYRWTDEERAGGDDGPPSVRMLERETVRRVYEAWTFPSPFENDGDDDKVVKEEKAELEAAEVEAKLAEVEAADVVEDAETLLTAPPPEALDPLADSKMQDPTSEETVDPGRTNSSVLQDGPAQTVLNPEDVVMEDGTRATSIPATVVSFAGGPSESIVAESTEPAVD